MLLIDAYTREAGCRNLEREIGSLMRHAATSIVKGKRKTLRIDDYFTLKGLATEIAAPTLP